MIPIRKSIKIILINEENKKILLMSADDPKTKSVNGDYQGKFWFLIGGKIEKNEDFFSAAKREILEETGLKENQYTLGPIVWKGKIDLILNDVLTHLDQTFIVVKTKKSNVFFNDLDDWEKKSLLKLKWFSLDEIKNSKEPIYPQKLSIYLIDILNNNYPKDIITIDL